MNKPSYKKLYQAERTKNILNEQAIKEIVELLHNTFKLDAKLEYTEMCIEKCITIKKDDLQIIIRTGEI